MANKDATPGAISIPFVPVTRAGGGLCNKCKGSVELNIELLNFQSCSHFRPTTLVGGPNTPPIFNWIAPIFDVILPSIYQSSDINTLAGGMVLEAERALKAGENKEGKGKVVDGDVKRKLYSEIPWSHGANPFKK